MQPFSLVKRKDSDMSLWSVDLGKEEIDSDISHNLYNKELPHKRFTMINNSFACENCKNKVSKHPSWSARNHCPNCLYSKHLDWEFPWDRASKCLGLMKPVWLDHRKNKGLMLVHECQKCKKKMLNRIAEDDDWELIREL